MTTTRRDDLARLLDRAGASRRRAAREAAIAGRRADHLAYLLAVEEARTAVRLARRLRLLWTARREVLALP